MVVDGTRFYPGTGSNDSITSNVMNIPIPPLWQQSTSGGASDEAAPSPSESDSSDGNRPNSGGGGGGRRRRGVERPAPTRQNTKQDKRSIMANGANLLKLNAFGYVTVDVPSSSIMTFNPMLFVQSATFPCSYQRTSSVFNARVQGRPR